LNTDLRQQGAPLVVTLDSITQLEQGHRGAVVVAASHGGVYCGYLAAAGGVRAVVLNDAGVGLENAGIAGLTLLDTVGIPALTVDSRSARIGDGQDMLRRGRVSHANGNAAELGCTVGFGLPACIERLRAAPLGGGALPVMAESRQVLAEIGGVRVVGIDSVSLIEPADRDCIVITGSHGGLLGGVAATAVRHPCLAVAFNDAGGGADDAGYGRLPALDAMGIAGVTVSHASARIGDARSTWTTGIVSAANQHARQAGATLGASLQSAVARMAQALRHGLNDGGPPKP
jgi:hypothetical protein